MNYHDRKIARAAACEAVREILFDADGLDFHLIDSIVADLAESVDRWIPVEDAP